MEDPCYLPFAVFWIVAATELIFLCYMAVDFFPTMTFLTFTSIFSSVAIWYLGDTGECFYSGFLCGVVIVIILTIALVSILRKVKDDVLVSPV